MAPTISNAIITTRATSVKTGASDSEVTNSDFGPPKPTEHEIVYYKTCLACREQQDLCKVLNLRAMLAEGPDMSLFERGKASASALQVEIWFVCSAKSL